MLEINLNFKIGDKVKHIPTNRIMIVDYIKVYGNDIIVICTWFENGVHYSLDKFNINEIEKII